MLRVRDALAHAKPVTNSDQPETTTQEALELSAKLSAAGVKRCRFTGAGNAMYPDALLGAGGATWALGVALDCADEFYHRLGIAPRYARLRSQLVVGKGA